MAIKTTSILPFPVTSIPDRLSPIFAADKTVVTTTAGTGAVKRLNRIQSASFAFSTPVTEITEMGAQFRVGGIDDLGEVKIKLDYFAVGINNIAALCGTAVNTSPGSTTTIGLTQLQSATVDIIRMVADPQNNIFGTLYIQDAVLEEYGVDIKEKSVVTESVAGMGPNAILFGGYVIPKVYVANGTDVTNGYLGVSSIYGADEAPVQVYQPPSNMPASYWQQNGANYFLKIEKVPGALLSNTPVRYFEFINAPIQSAIAVGTTYCTPGNFIPQLTTVGQKVTMGLGTANVETVTVLAVGSLVNTNSGSSTVVGAGAATITPASMLGIFPGVTLQCQNSNGTNLETVTVSATTSTTFTATFATAKSAGFTITSKAPSFQAAFAKVHAVNDLINPQLTAAQNNIGTATYVAASNRLYTGDTLVSGDAYRLTVLSYNTDSYATSVPANTPDTADRPGVNARLVPVKINALQVTRCQSAAFKFTLRRDHVQGVGENSIIYGVPNVPDVAISLDFKETDLSLMSQLLTGSKNLSALGGGISNDFQDLNYVTRTQLSTAYPVSAVLFDPFTAGAVLCNYSTPQIVVKDIEYQSSNKADNTIRITAMDITGNFTISYTSPS